ncbi:MAG TPA: hypothetical protein VGD98_18440 [Ktedonobacteraceae bacterium]
MKEQLGVGTSPHDSEPHRGASSVTEWITGASAVSRMRSTQVEALE